MFHISSRTAFQYDELRKHNVASQNIYSTNLYFLFADVAGSVRLPVLIGSGVTHDNVEHYLDASAMIIGSHFKRGGVWANAVDPESVKKFMGKVHLLRK